MESLKNFFDRKFELSKKDILSIAITAVYALITIILVAHHEPFEDEVNVWMILHNLEGFAMWKHIFEDGNPPGFYMLLLPFVKAGMSYFCVQFACWLSCVLSVFLLNRFSPFPAFLNIIITFSAPMLYVYPVIARCYSLLPLLIMLAAVLYPCGGNSGGDSKSRNDEIRTVLYLLVLAAIAQNHVIMFAFAGLMFALFVYQHFYKAGERRMSVIAAAFIVFAALSEIVLQCATAVKTNISYYRFNHISLESLKSVFSPFFSCFFDISSCSLFSGGIDKGNFIFYFSLFAAVLLCICFLCCLYRKNKIFAVICLSAILFPLYIYITRYSIILPYRVFAVHLFFAFFLWIMLKKGEVSLSSVQGRILSVSALFLFLMSVPTGVKTALRDFRGTFSSAREITDFIKNNIPDDGKSILVSPATWQGTTVAYYMHPRPVFALNGKIIKYIELHHGALENRLAESGITKGKEYIYIVASKYQREYLESCEYTFIYETQPAMIVEEEYVLYRIP